MYDYMVLGQFLPAHLPSRQLPPPDNCPPDYSHLGITNDNIFMAISVSFPWPSYIISVFC